MILTCRKKIPLRWIGFSVLPGASVSLNTAVVGAAFVFSVKKFVENPAGVAFVLSLPGFLAIIFAPLSSFLSDRIWTRFGRRKPFVISGGIGMIIALTAMPLAPNFWLLVAAYVLYHISDGLSAPRDPLQQEIVPPSERGRATGTLTWCQNLAIVVFYSVMLGRFDDVRFFAGFPLHGESVIYWSAALLLIVTLLLVVLGIKEIDPKSSLVGQRLSPRGIVRSLFDRELRPVYLLVLSHGLLNFFVGFGPFLTTLLYTDQWNYSKQEMGTNVAIGGVVNLFIIGLLTFFADKLPRMRALRVLIALSLLWNAFYFCYVNLILPDKRPSLVEIIIFGEVLSIISILVGLVYMPLIYDYVRRNKMGTFAAGMQITTRGTQLFTLNGIGVFVWAYAALFQPPAGESTRVVLRENTDRTALLQTLRQNAWQYPRDEGSAATTSAPPSAISAEVWQADGIAAKQGRAWEIRLRDKNSEKLAAEKIRLEKLRSPLLVSEKRLLDSALVADARGEGKAAAEAREAAQPLHVETGKFGAQIETIDRELARRAENLRAQITTALGARLLSDGEQISKAALAPALIIEFSTAQRANTRSVERMLDELHRSIPQSIDLRVFKRDAGYGLAASVLASRDSAENTALIDRVSAAVTHAVEKRAPELRGGPLTRLSVRETTALQLQLEIVEQPTGGYISPVTRAVNAILGWFDHAPSPTRNLDAIARSLRVPGQTTDVRVNAPAGEHALSVVAIFAESSTSPPTAGAAASADDTVPRDDAITARLRQLLGTSPTGPAVDAPATLRRARSFYDRVESAAAAQRITVARSVLATGYAPLKYDYMSGYIWVLGLGVVGLWLTYVFGGIEKRGGVSKRGVEEAAAS